MLTLLTCLKLITGSYDCSFQKIPWAKRFLRSWSARHQAVMVQATSLATIPHTGIKNRDADYWHFWSGLCDNGPSYFYHIYDCNLFSHNAVKEFQNCKTKRFLLQVAKMCFCNLMVSTASSICRSLYFRGIPDIVCISFQFEIFLVLHWLQNKNLTRSLSGCPRANKPKSRHKDGAESEPLRWFNSILVMSILAL